MTAQQLDRLQLGLSTSGRTQSLGYSHSPRQPQHFGRKGRAVLVQAALTQQTASMVAAPQSNGTPAHDKFEPPAALKGVKRVNPLTDKFEVSFCCSWLPTLAHISCSALASAPQTKGLHRWWHGWYIAVCRSVQVIRFHHIDWWCADATNTQKRYLGIALPLHLLSYANCWPRPFHPNSPRFLKSDGVAADLAGAWACSWWQNLTSQRGTPPLQAMCCSPTSW